MLREDQRSTDGPCMMSSPFSGAVAVAVVVGDAGTASQRGT